MQASRRGLAIQELGYSPTEYAHYQAVVNAVIKGAPVTWVTCVASLLQNSTVWEVLSELLS